MLFVLTVCETIIASFQVAEGYPPNFKKALLLHFLNLFQSKQLGHDHLVVIMQMLILPMLAHSFQNDQSWEVVDQSIIKTIVDRLLDPPEEVYFLKELNVSSAPICYLIFLVLFLNCPYFLG